MDDKLIPFRESAEDWTREELIRFIEIMLEKLPTPCASCIYYNKNYKCRYVNFKNRENDFCSKGRVGERIGRI